MGNEASTSSDAEKGNQEESKVSSNDVDAGKENGLFTEPPSKGHETMDPVITITPEENDENGPRDKEHTELQELLSSENKIETTVTSVEVVKDEVANHDSEKDSEPRLSIVKTDKSKSTTMAPSNSTFTEAWLEEAVEYWVARGLKVIASDGEIDLEARLASAAESSKKLRPSNRPPLKEYIEKTVARLRCDPRLAWNERKDGTVVYRKAVNRTPLFIVHERIAELVSERHPLDASWLPQIYKKRYGKNLDYKSYGFAKLIALLEASPSIQVTKGSKKHTSVRLLSPKQKSDSKPVSQHLPSDSIGTAGKQAHTAAISKTDEPAIPLRNSERVSESAPPALPTLSFYEFATTKVESPGNAADETGDLTCEDAPQSGFDFVQPRAMGSLSAAQACLGDKDTSMSFQEMAFLGCERINENEVSIHDQIFINTHQPFCLVTVGVQGAGKSHTLSCALESCLLDGAPDDVIRLNKPMTALVLHYDQSTTSVCEAAGLLTPLPGIPGRVAKAFVPREKAVVLVSPSYYKQRKAFYGDYCTVRPLLFKWNSLTADHIKRIMGISASDNQLYVASFMTLLRRYQRQSLVPQFNDFVREVKEVCNIKGQSGPLDQRLDLLASVIAESEVNANITSESFDIQQAISSKLDLIIVDLTDPLLAKDEANGLFQVITEQFRAMPTRGGKLLALDEAHKFMDGTTKKDGLSQAIVDVARLMRHDGIRLVVSTQSPKALAPELLELVSVAVLHHFHSQDWWTYIRQKLPLPESAWATILTLGAGNALVFSSRSQNHVVPIAIRRRLTADFGASRTNK